MIQFKSQDKFYIAGRGTVFTGQADREIPVSDTLNKSILIDGAVYICTGIERFLKWRPPGAPIEKGENIGLLVREKKS